MDNKKLQEWLSKLADNLREQEHLSVFQDESYSLRVCRNYNIQFSRGIREVIEILQVPYKEQIIDFEDGERLRRLSFEYDGVEFCELEGCDAGNF